MNHGFFTIISRKEFEASLKKFTPLQPESVSLNRAANRILAEPLVATHDWPLLDRSCMDGFAVMARDIFGASESNPGYVECVTTLPIDVMPDINLRPGECARIPTGGVLPDGADAVIMVEQTGEMDGSTIEICKSVTPGENVMQRGEDATAGGVALEAGTTLRPQEIGLAAALGFEKFHWLGNRASASFPRATN